jgi:hypothetical protein
MMSLEYTGSAMTEMAEISERLGFERMDQVYARAIELRNEKSTVSLFAFRYTLDASRSLSNSKRRTDDSDVGIEFLSWA